MRHWRDSNEGDGTRFDLSGEAALSTRRFTPAGFACVPNEPRFFCSPYQLGRGPTVISDELSDLRRGFRVAVSPAYSQRQAWVRALLDRRPRADTEHHQIWPACLREARWMGWLCCRGARSSSCPGPLGLVKPASAHNRLTRRAERFPALPPAEASLKTAESARRPRRPP